jgi:hypothetical protein
MNIHGQTRPVYAQSVTVSTAESIRPSIEFNHNIEASTVQQSEAIQQAIPNSGVTYSRPTVLYEANTVPSKTDNEVVKQAHQSQQSNKEQEDDIETTPVSTQPMTNREKDQSYTEAELAIINTLEVRQTEVIEHEQAHAAVGGQHASSPTYSYETGPDGKKYAVEGEVSISTSPIQGDPKATLAKARQIKAAALAPSEPSSQDIKVAAKADQLANQARNELLKVKENLSGEDSTKSSIENNSATTSTDVFDVFSKLNINNKIQQQMHMQNRNQHINQVYQSSAQDNQSSTFNIQI